jgi:mannose-6-phosphate isomerase-like protein (cupin superfamily)
MRIPLIFFLLVISFDFLGQTIIQPKQIQVQLNPQGIGVVRLTGDELSTGFLIEIADTVYTHKHVFHSEHVYILQGEGLLYFNEEVTPIKQGDLLFIPKENWHAVKVTSVLPMRALSIQSPAFDGTDRVVKP